MSEGPGQGEPPPGEEPAAPRPPPRARKAAPAAKKAAAASVAPAAKKAAAKKAAAKKAAAKKAGAVGAGAPTSGPRRGPVRPADGQETATAPPAQPVPPAEPAPIDNQPPPPPPPPPPPAPPAAPGWGPPAWAPPPPGYAPPTSPGIDSLAITSMVLGIVAFPLFMFLLPAIVAVILGLLARRNIKREPGKGGKGMATAGIVLGMLSLLGAIAFVVGLLVFDDDSGDGVSYALLEPGNCYDAEFFDERDVELRSCSEEHNREAFAVLDHPAPPGSEHPGRESLRRHAERECADRFPAYVGRAYEDSRLEIIVVFPRRDDWEDENLRRIVCAAARPDDGDLTRSVRDSGI